MVLLFPLIASPIWSKARSTILKGVVRAVATMRKSELSYLLLDPMISDFHIVPHRESPRAVAHRRCWDCRNLRCPTPGCGHSCTCGLDECTS
ncbi:hypothetical protein F4680DRAFT_374223 [Xylaria scruposa]|nr:hypothetical protein F4680DRAFT_374223 [Xylaria scruposa]